MVMMKVMLTQNANLALPTNCIFLGFAGVDNSSRIFTAAAVSYLTSIAIDHPWANQNNVDLTPIKSSPHLVFSSLQGLERNIDFSICCLGKLREGAHGGQGSTAF